MPIRPSVSIFTLAVLTLFVANAERARAGSFFGPSCYGSSYAYEYPNRAHNIFGCGPCSRCTARHPLFGRLFHRNQAAPAPMINEAAPTPMINEAAPAPMIVPSPLAPQMETAPAPALTKPAPVFTKPDGKEPF